MTLWQTGKHGKYLKLPLLKLGSFVVYAIHIPLGGFISWHLDPSEHRRKLHKINIFLKKATIGGTLMTRIPYLDGEKRGAGWLTLRHKRRLSLMRPDETEHSISEVKKGSAWMLAIGWTTAKPKR